MWKFHKFLTKFYREMQDENLPYAKLTKLLSLSVINSSEIDVSSLSNSGSLAFARRIRIVELEVTVIVRCK